MLNAYATRCAIRMKYLHSLVLVLLMSALAGSAQAHHGNSFDGYHEQAPKQQSLLSSQELESDQPDEAASSTSLAWLAKGTDSLSVATRQQLSAANYRDYHSRAPPVLP